MRTRHLGPNGPAVSSLGLGCMGMSQSYGTPDPEGGVGAIRRALELGVTFFDTADAYGEGANEKLVGAALREHRDHVVIATKCGFVSPGGASPSSIDGSPDHIRRACDASLRRLGVDTIDLYYLHRVDPATPIEASVGAMAELVRAGKVRYLGLSEVSGATLRRAHRVHPITAVQSEYSLFTRDPESGVLPVCGELGIGFVPFSPLGRGTLSARFRSMAEAPPTDFRRTNPRFAPGNLEHIVALADDLDRLARDLGCTAAQLAIAWLLARGPYIVPIPGTKRATAVEENVRAVDLQLSTAELARIEEAIPVGAAAGARYNPAMQALVDR